ncbi:ankyrin [Anaeromyces robustus]|uniref:Ankyrin n=1 Tax=Anaeromyces robustus TaxID=1754192 RepID=A0A1Y1X9H5_9FUNG|nr:ankyrin [Anaeromyces robustus]|eukprot:ORX82395.1 ankyrin [Anaeromyces robustus]
MNETNIVIKLLTEEVSIQNFITLYYYNNLSINKINNESFDVLIYSIENSINNEIIEFFINQYNNLNYEFTKNQIPLFMVLERENYYIANKLIEKGADINFRNKDGDNVLFYLYQNKLLNRKILRYIISKRIHINSKDRIGYNIICYFIENGNEDLLNYIFEYFTYNIHFVLKCLTAYKNKIGMSSYEIILWMNKDKGKLKISETMIKLATEHWNINIISNIIFFRFNLPLLKLYNRNNILPKVTEYNQIHLVKYLVYNGAYINKRDQDGNTSLIIAAKNGNYDIVKFLVDEKAQVNKVNNIGYTPLMYASQNGFYSIVQYLLNNGADVNLKSKGDIENEEENIQDININAPKISLVSQIKDQSKKIFGTVENGCSALMCAAKNGHLKIIQKLCDQGAFIKEKNNQGCNALMIAAENGHLDVIQYLHERGLSFHGKNKEKKTALILAAQNGHLSVVKYLIEQGVNIHKRDIYDKNAFVYACQMGYRDILEYLDESSSKNFIQKIESMPISSSNSLKLKLKSKSKSITKLISQSISSSIQKSKLKLQSKLKFNSKSSKNKEMGLMLAAFNGHLDIIQYLYERGTKLNCESKQGETPLILACMGGHLKVVKFLYSHGLNIKEGYKNRKTALMYAWINGHLDIIEFLYEHDVRLFPFESTNNNKNNCPSIN